MNGEAAAALWRTNGIARCSVAVCFALLIVVGPDTARTEDRREKSDKVISVDLQDTDLGSAFKLLGEAAGVNIVLYPGVAGTVSIRLTDVPVFQAIDTVARAKGCFVRRSGSVLYVRPLDQVGKTP